MIKVLVSCVLLAVAIYTAATSGPLFQTLIQTPAWVLVVVITGYALSQGLSSVKWWLLIRASGIQVSFSNTIKAYFMGMFVNFFGLGVVGGDLARALLLGEQKAKALATVAADRVHGLTILSLVGSLAGILVFYFGEFTQNPFFLIALSLGSLTLIIMWFLGPTLLQFIPGQHPMVAKIKSLSEAFPRNPGTLLAASLLSVIFHLFQIFLIFVMGQAFGVSIPMEYLAVAIPLTNIVSTLPISWNGLGVRENALAFFLAPQIISSTEAVAFGGIWLLAVMATSAIGGLIAFWSKDFALLQKGELPTS